MKRSAILVACLLSVPFSLPSILRAEPSVIDEYGAWGVSYSGDYNSTVILTLDVGEGNAVPALYQVASGDDLTWADTMDVTLSGNYMGEASSQFIVAVLGEGYMFSTSAPSPDGSSDGMAVNAVNQANITWVDIPQDALGVIWAASHGAYGVNGVPSEDVNLNQWLDGYDGGEVTFTHSGSAQIEGVVDNSGSGDSSVLEAMGILMVESTGGNGGFLTQQGNGYAGDGGDGGTVTVTTGAGSLIENVVSFDDSNVMYTAGIYALSQGGMPGYEEQGEKARIGNSGDGGDVSVTAGGIISGISDNSVGILAVSLGGAGGTINITEDMNSVWGTSGAGGKVEVTLQSGAGIHVSGASGAGIIAASLAGASSSESEPDLQVQNEDVTVTLESGSVINAGQYDSSTGEVLSTYSLGVLAISAGTASVLDLAGSSSSANTGGVGYAGDVTLANNGSVTTYGELSVGLAALSVGGSGQVANSGDDSLTYLGASSISSNLSSSAGEVVLVNAGSVSTLGASAHAIIASSGGSGGGLMRVTVDGEVENGEWTTGTVVGNSTDANANQGGSDGGTVLVVNTGTISTGNSQGGGAGSIGIIGQSIGGGGGTAGGSHATAFIGDAGGSGGDGGDVYLLLAGDSATLAQYASKYPQYSDKIDSVTTSGSTAITTYDDGSIGVLAQSVGGGGGNGGNAVGVFTAVGGSGGSGGDGVSVDVALDAATTISTSGDFSGGLIAQSIGGGGGNGGYAKSYGTFISDAIGGTGGKGGDGGGLMIDSAATITTNGNQSDGILAQSIGGGGGTGGAAIAKVSSAVVSVSLSLGGAGGDGGNVEDDLSVTNSGTITTGDASTAGTSGPVPDGANSIGMLIQAIGGGGGKGGSATSKSNSFGVEDIPVSVSYSYSLGGSGGTGGSVTGTLTGNNTGTITTYGDSSYGILAQSIGGGGGVGGDATATSTSYGGETLDLDITTAMGATGGSGGDGGDIVITNGDGDTQAGSIITSGQNSTAILAQSISGGGGAGGTGNSSTKVGAGDDDDDDDDSSTSVGLTISLGGSGGTGGAAGSVKVTNASNGTISTSGAGSKGIVAHSIGGGGGDAGGGVASSQDTYTVSVNVGGSGGAGGDGGSVTVTNNGTITTSAGDASGIVAQSIGGGGGNGGSADAKGSSSDDDGDDSGSGGDSGGDSAPGNGSGGSGTVSATAFYATASDEEGDSGDDSSDGDDSQTYTASVNVGGAGGVAGQGGSVAVTNAAVETTVDGESAMAGGVITTSGERSYGILAQSIGGGGGTGGSATSNDSKDSELDISVNVGGKGGDGGEGGGEVAVTNVGSIVTDGDHAHAIFAQSIGGGGGDGADGSANGSATLSLGVDISDTGYTSGSGGTVSINDYGTITTKGADSIGILAQSIGGGGGQASSGTKKFKLSGLRDGNVDMTLGKNSGSASDGNGGQVDLLVDSCTTTTQGDWSHGILVQSIGGGGGKASYAVLAGSTTTANVSMGQTSSGSSGAGGSGAEVFLNLIDATISTGTADTGLGAMGIVAQSIGGGGGFAHIDSSGVSASQSGDGIQIGTGGAGDGGEVVVGGASSGQNSAIITTQGDFAHGMLLQSIGGSGGFVGQGSSDATPDADTDIAIRLGGSSSSSDSGDGGTVTMSNTQLNVTTAGDNAIGVLAQSIGGGGGAAYTQYANSGEATLGAASTTSSTGGDVTISLSPGSAITTSGVGAHGVVAQSIGGGGGLVGGLSGSSVEVSSILSGSEQVAAQGDGGEVIVEVYDITTSGTSAYGILAQSLGAGGGIYADGDSLYLGSNGTISTGASGTGGAVGINVFGAVQATGADSVGVFAQSSGQDGEGSMVTVNVSDGASVTASDDSKAAIWVDGGDADNVVTVEAGATVDAGSSVAVQYTGSSTLTVNNYGTVTGTVDLENDSGALGTFNNYSSNTLYAVDTIQANVNNSGRISTVLASGGYQQVTVTGDFTQTSTGVLQMSADFDSGASDLFHVQGNATLDGQLAIDRSSLSPGSVTVFQFDNAPAGSLTVVDSEGSPIVSYVASTIGSTWVVTTNADFTTSAFSLEDNPQAVAVHLQSIWDAGSSSGLSSVLNALADAAGVSQSAYSSALAQLSPGVTLGMGAVRTQELIGFGDNALDGARFRGDSVMLEQTSGVWFHSSGDNAWHGNNGGLPTFRLNTTVQQVGGQDEIAQNWFLGGAVAYEYSWLKSQDGFSKADGSSALGAVFVKYEMDQWLFSLSAFGGGGAYDTSRALTLTGTGGTAHGSPVVYSVGGLLRVDYTVPMTYFYLRPNISFGVVSVFAEGYTESGAGSLSLQVESRDQTTFVVTPRLEIGGRIDLDNGMALHPYVNAGVTFLSDNTWNQEARLVSASGATPNFTTSLPMDDVTGRLDAGLRLEISKHVSVGLQYNGAYSENINTNGGTFSVGWTF
ncbi:hypothetical protein H5P28_00530 [Ruficoccus amylovorans]|uniref:Autotransporter domain-containing protein n=1 Tax=Ruficoccus amylovorans TaxID=1804625 RepID=A0A842H926_9BACT|nr:autotransporter outer membrane beta-barrel domain-containing protein [Ruficoccus amylovorans]MBC2592735.1 hypothetical protein [Ruficoccus amylovorans]